jgi:hypothetical protein
MRVIELSNHPELMREQAYRQRLTTEQAAKKDYEAAVSQHRASVASIRQERDAVLAGFRWWRSIPLTFVLWKAQLLETPLRPTRPAGNANLEASLTAGMEGEQLVAAQLGCNLGDEWMLFRGYKNRGGEIDHILLGPRALVAIEVKHRNATVHCDGNSWWYDKYDKYGNHVGRGELTDRRGRSPSEQLNEPANLLENFLQERGHGLPVQRVVLLTHRKSRVGSCHNVEVQLIATSTDYILDLLNELPPTVTTERSQAIERLIVRDHDFHESRRRR